MDAIQQTIFAGVDIVKNELYACAPPGEYRLAVACGGEDVAKRFDFFKRHGATHVIVESTGEYDRIAIVACHEAGLQICLINPRKAKNFAVALGVLAKNGRIDARTLAFFGDRRHTRAMKKTLERQHVLNDLVTRRRQLVAM